MKIQLNKFLNSMEKMELERVDNRLKPLLNTAITNGIFPGAAIGVYQYKEGLEKRVIITHGVTRSDEKGVAVSSDTLFDLASLTKPLCTVLSVLCLIQKNDISWQTKIFDLLPFAPLAEYKNISVDQLLSHSAGLIAYKPFYELFQPKIRKENTAQLLHLFLNEQLAYVPGTGCLYSDIGFILLGSLIENVSRTSLDNFYRKEITAPLHLSDTLKFRPITLSNNELNKNIAATERCPWRKKTVQGEVHDEHAWLMNGVAGHAGLFGTIGGVMSLTEHLLHQWRGRAGHPGFNNQLLRKALTKKDVNHTWCRGYDTPSAQGSSAGNYFSEKSVGHLGFTGTSFWIDLEQEIIVILLTNRVHPSRKNEKLKNFRPVFHNTVLEALGEN